MINSSRDEQATTALAAAEGIRTPYGVWSRKGFVFRWADRRGSAPGTSQPVILPVMVNADGTHNRWVGVRRRWFDRAWRHPCFVLPLPGYQKSARSIALPSWRSALRGRARPCQLSSCDLSHYLYRSEEGSYKLVVGFAFFSLGFCLNGSTTQLYICTPPLHHYRPEQRPPPPTSCLSITIQQ